MEELDKDNKIERPQKVEYVPSTKFNDISDKNSYYENVVNFLPVILPIDTIKVIQRQENRNVNRIYRKLKLRRIRRDYYKLALDRLENFEAINKAIIIKGLQRDIVNDAIVNQLRKKLANKNLTEIEIVYWFINSLTEVVNEKALTIGINFLINRYTIFTFFIIFFTSFWFISYNWFQYSKSMHFYNQGLVDLKRGHFLESENNFNRGLESYPNIKQCNKYGELLIKKKYFQKAEEKYQKALEINPYHYKTLTNYVNLFIRQRKFSEAEKIYSNYLNVRYPKDYKILTWWGQMYIEWGKKDSSKLLVAREIYQSFPQNRKYIPLLAAKNLNIDFLQNKYKLAKERYSFLAKHYSKYIDLVSYLNWLNYLLDFFQKIMIDQERQFNQISKQQFQSDQVMIHNNIVTILDQLKTSKYKNDPYYIYLKSKWHFLNKKYGLAEKQSQAGLRHLRKNEAPYYFEKSDLFLMSGMSKYMQEKYLSAVNDLKLAININNKNFLAHYYLGNIYALQADDLEEGIKYYENAFAYWQTNKNQKNYYKLIYRLGYFNYKMGLMIDQSEDAQQQQDFFQKSLKYWNHPRLFNSQDQFLEYCLGLVYLKLAQYDFAYAIYAQQLERFLPLYHKYERIQTIDNLQESKNLKLLTDIYNNLAIALLGRKHSTADSLQRIKSRTMALNYFHISTKLRKKLNINESDSTINFNLLLRDENLEIPIFKISDSLLKKDLI